MKEKNDAKRIFHRLEQLGLVIPGTIREVFLRCGRKNCACSSGKTKDKHGPYYFWSFKQDGRLTSVSLTPAEVKRYQGWIDNRRKLEAIVAEMLEDGIKNALKQRAKRV